ncbi:MAG: Murein DD-endopeptidase MepM [Chloroflexi bacterium]|nr:MAG: Murein DD-endopeptidase MepM [Chloroflexota bacterium]
MTDDQSEAQTGTDISDPPVEAFPISRDLRWLVIGVLVLAAAAIGATLALLADAGAPPPDAQSTLAATETATTTEAPPPTETEQPAPAEDEAVDDESASEVQSQSAQTRPDQDPSPSQAQADPTRDPPQADASTDTDAAEDSTAPPDADAQAVADQPQPEPDPAPAPIDDAILAIGPLSMPIAGACFPDFAGQLPGAPRAYRNGIHEGVDFYPGWACASIELGTPVLAVGEGRVIRADWNYDDLTTDAYFAMEARGFTGPDDLDTFRGRQIWVQHGDGVVARYAHLSGIAEGIAEGAPVAAGDVLGFVGESGTPGSLREAGSEIHLHFELRLDDGYLGQGEPAARAVQLYRAVFSTVP